MGYWNHRVTLQRYPGDDVYAIREVYYSEDGRIISWTADEIAAAGDSPQEVAETLQRMIEATTKPVIDITDENNPTEVTT